MDPALPALDEIALPTIYAIAVYPSWEHWHPTDCPMPIREWLNEHCPDVTVEAVSGWNGVLSLDPYGMQIMDRGAFPEPMFRLGFNAEQAEEFRLFWSNPSNSGAEMEDDFWFLIATREHPFQPFVLQADDQLDLELPSWQPPQEDQRIDAC
jgi:hypothetical protein